jgi:hypothetical protein
MHGWHGEGTRGRRRTWVLFGIREENNRTKMEKCLQIMVVMQRK